MPYYPVYVHISIKDQFEFEPLVFRKMYEENVLGIDNASI